MKAEQAALRSNPQARRAPIFADLAARMLGEIPVGVVNAVIGAPFFLLLLRRVRAGYEL